jgi:hypothetical protein
MVDIPTSADFSTPAGGAALKNPTNADFFEELPPVISAELVEAPFDTQ